MVGKRNLWALRRYQLGGGPLGEGFFFIGQKSVPRERKLHFFSSSVQRVLSVYRIERGLTGDKGIEKYLRGVAFTA